MGKGDEFLRDLAHRVRELMEEETYPRRLNDQGEPVCFYCGHPLRADPSGKTYSEREHVIPRSHGGIDAATNYVAACGYCNSTKGARFPLDWIAESGQVDMPIDLAFDLIAKIIAAARLSYAMIGGGAYKSLDGLAVVVDIWSSSMSVTVPSGHAWRLVIGRWINTGTPCEYCGDPVFAGLKSFPQNLVQIECRTCGAQDFAYAFRLGRTAEYIKEGYRGKMHGKCWHFSMPWPTKGQGQKALEGTE